MGMPGGDVDWDIVRAHAGDVLSNAGFALVAVWGWLTLWPRRGSARLRAGW